MTEETLKKARKAYKNAPESFLVRLQKLRILANKEVKATSQVSYAGRSYTYAPEKEYLDFLSKHAHEYSISYSQRKSKTITNNPIMEMEADDKGKTSTSRLYLFLSLITELQDQLSPERYASEDMITYNRDQKQMGANETYTKRRAWATALCVSPEDDHDGEVTKPEEKKIDESIFKGMET